MNRTPDYGTRLRCWRKRAGFSQRQVAAILELSHGLMSRYESGTIQPRFETLDRLLALYMPGSTVDQARQAFWGPLPVSPATEAAAE